jgi:integrase
MPSPALSRPSSDEIAPTLRSHFDVLYRRQRLFGKSPETVRLYGYTFDYFERFLGREPLLSDLTDDRVTALMEWIVDRSVGLGLSSRTANKTRDQLVALWNFLARKRLVDQFPEVPAFPEAVRDPIAWTRQELRTLWNLCENQRGEICGVPAGLWWITIHSVSWDSLERIGAVRQSVWSDLSSDFIWMHFRAEIRKGRKRDQTAKLHPSTGELLRAIRYPDRDLLFPWEMHPSYLWTKYKAMRRSVGLPVDRMHSFHCIRRTGASFAEAAGVDATRLLGHSSRRVTERYYLSPKIVGKPQGADVLFRPNAAIDPPA